MNATMTTNKVRKNSLLSKIKAILKDYEKFVSEDEVIKAAVVKATRNSFIN